MIKAVIFDFDGVIALTEKPRFQVIQKVAKDNNIVIKENALSRITGRTTLAFLTEILNEEEKELIGKIIQEYEKEYIGNIIQYVKPISFSVDFIKEYTGSKIFSLATMSSRKKVDRLTKHLGIHSKFKIILTKENVSNHKPNPEVYLKTALELGILPNECIVIEDSLVGVNAALNAQMQCFVLLNGENNKADFFGSSVAGFIASKKDLYSLFEIE